MVGPLIFKGLLYSTLLLLIQPHTPYKAAEVSSNIKAVSQNSKYTYVVKNGDYKGLKAISEKLYKTWRKWKEIASWNNIKSPYTLEIGQILELKIIPNNYKTGIISKNGSDALMTNSSYTVKEGDGLGLSFISLRLYGSNKYWLEIAKINNIKKPYSVYKGQLLKLNRASTLKPEESEKLVLSFWRKRLKVEIVGSKHGIKRTQIANTNANEKTKKEEELLEKSAVYENEEIYTEEMQEEPSVPEPPIITNLEPTKKIILKKQNLVRTAALVPEAKEELMKLPPPEPESAEEFYNKGKEQFDGGEYERALANFKQSRTLNEESLPSWFFEIRTLKLLEQDDEAKKTATHLLDERPELKNLPMFRTMFSNKGQE